MNWLSLISLVLAVSAGGLAIYLKRQIADVVDFIVATSKDVDKLASKIRVLESTNWLLISLDEHEKAIKQKMKKVTIKAKKEEDNDN